jgi:RNA polymerase-binding transcription factor DksA
VHPEAEELDARAHQPPRTSERDPATRLTQLELAETKATLDTVEAELDAVDAALVRLDGEDARRCEVCGGLIDTQLFKADPLTARCAEHAPARP